MWAMVGAYISPLLQINFFITYSSWQLAAEWSTNQTRDVDHFLHLFQNPVGVLAHLD